MWRIKRVGLRLISVIYFLNSQYFIIFKTKNREKKRLFSPAAGRLPLVGLFVDHRLIVFLHRRPVDGQASRDGQQQQKRRRPAEPAGPARRRSAVRHGPPVRRRCRRPPPLSPAATPAGRWSERSDGGILAGRFLLLYAF